MRTLEDWICLEDLRWHYPGMDPMKNSLRKNMILLRHAARRGKPPDVMEESQNFMKDLEEELRLQAAGAGR